MIAGSILVVPGWLIALPIILQTRFDNLRLWQQVLIGTLIGPAIMIAIGIYGAAASGYGLGYKREAFNLLNLAIVVSFVTSTLYLTLLKLSTRPRIQPNT